MGRSLPHSRIITPHPHSLSMAVEWSRIRSVGVQRENILQCLFGNLATQAADRWLARLGEFPPGSVVKRVGDRHAPVGSLAGGHRLPIGMIAPDEVAPAGRQL